jgi:hypothetical protein
MNSKEVLQSIRAALGFESEVVEFESALLKDGTEIRWNGELAVGTPITVVTAEGELPAPDATHELEDGTLVTTQNGAVTEIVNPTLVEGPAESQQMNDSMITDQAIVDQVVSIIQQASPELSPEIASAIATQVIGTLVDIIGESEPTPILEMMRKIKEMGKEMYTKDVIQPDSKTEEMQKDIDALKDGMRKLISVMEGFAAIPNHEPIQKPHTPSKRDTMEESINKFAKALKNLQN